MTTIAYCNGVMACDSSYCDDNIQVASRTKLTRLASGAILGGAGDADDRDVIALLNNVKTEKQLPSRRQLAELAVDYRGLLVLPNGKVFAVEIHGDPKAYADCSIVEYDRGIYAVGSGDTLAIGHMGAAADAIEAVKFATKWDRNSRLPVHSMTLRKVYAKDKKARVRQRKGA